MPRLNPNSTEPQRVIQRGGARTMGERARPRVGAGTVAQAPAPSTPDRRIGIAPAPVDRGRHTPGTGRAPVPRTTPTAPVRAAASSPGDRRPIERLTDLEARCDALEARFDRAASLPLARELFMLTAEAEPETERGDTEPPPAP